MYANIIAILMIAPTTKKDRIRSCSCESVVSEAAGFSMAWVCLSTEGCTEFSMPPSATNSTKDESVNRGMSSGIDVFKQRYLLRDRGDPTPNNQSEIRALYVLSINAHSRIFHKP